MDYRFDTVDGSIFNGNHIQSMARFVGPGYPLATGPDDLSNSYDWRMGSWHPGICMVGLCDASVRSVENSADVAVLRLLGRRDDGQPFDVNDL